jgi:two-component system OmpR family response regulator
MFLATEHFLPLNAVILVQIELPEDGGQIPITCRVVYVRDKDLAQKTGTKAGMGIQFLDLDNDSLTNLQRFVADHSVSQEPESVGRRRRGRALDVLIIDDDSAAREQIAKVFRERGDRVRSAKDGLAGLGECLRQPPDSILLDVQMPAIDGWQLVRILRSRPSLCSIPILLLTSLAGQQERLRGYKLGVDDYIGKPFEPDELLARVDRAVDRAQRPYSPLVQQKTLRGDFDQVSIASVLSFLELERKTGVLLLVADRTARVYIEAGRPLKVEIDGVPRTQSQRSLIDRVLDWTKGQFEFSVQDVACSDELGTSTAALLLEHARAQDESS